MNLRLSTYSASSFDRGASRWKEALWIVVKCLFFLPAWPLPSGFRVALLRMFGARVGKRVVLRSRVNITYPWRVSIGDDVWIGEEALLLSLASISIGSNSCISQRAFLCTGSHRFTSETFDLVTRPISVGEGCWIAAQSIVLPGVVFGDASMCQAGSVVMENVPPNTVVGGNPARGVH